MGCCSQRLLTRPWIIPTSPAHFVPKYFFEKAEVVEHLDTCDGTRDLFPMILSFGTLGQRQRYINW